MEADLGSLYPPALGPFFTGWEAREVETVKTRALVELDGRAVIHQKTQFYDSPPNWVFLGKNPAGTDSPFPGEIGGLRQLRPTRPNAGSKPAELGVWRLEISLRRLGDLHAQPILGSGTQGHGNLLLMRATPDGELGFGLDQWNFSMATSPLLAAGSSGLHRLEIFVGPQVTRQTWPADWHLSPDRLRAAGKLLRVWLDGEPVWTTDVAVNLDTYDEVALGSNPQGFSTADSYFLGSLVNSPYSPEEMREFVAKNLRLTPPTGVGAAPGRDRP